MTAANRVKCAFCDWTTMKVRTNKDKSHSPWMSRMEHHIETNHPDEYQRIFAEKLAGLDREDESFLDY